MKTYKKSSDLLEKSSNIKAKHISKKLELSGRIEHLVRNPAFITLKDNQENINSQSPCCLINPSKSELGKVSKQKLEKIIKIMVVQHLNKNQCNNSITVRKWFTALENKTDCLLIKFDIQEFYRSITEDILKTSISFASKYKNIPEVNIWIINHCCKSLLIRDNQPWKKKYAEGCFNHYR